MSQPVNANHTVPSPVPPSAHFAWPVWRRQLVCAAALAPVFASIYFGAFWLRFEEGLGQAQYDLFLSTVGWVVCAKLAVFGALGVFRGWGRFVTFHDLVVLMRAATTSSAALAMLDYLVFTSASAPRSVFLMDWCGTILLVGGMRTLTRLIDEREPLSLFGPKLTPVLVVGADEAGEALLRSLRRDKQLGYRVVGFLAESPAQLHRQISGVPVLGTYEQTCELARRCDVSLVLITAGMLNGQQVRNLVEDGRRHGVTVMVLPRLNQLLEQKVDLRPRDVSIEDLLRRDPVKLDLPELHRWLSEKTILVTGSAGSIGSEIARQLLRFQPRKIVLLDRSENGQFFLERELRRLEPDCELEICLADATDGMRLASVFRQHRPEVVFHAAAYKHVPLMEAHPGEAVKNIVVATRMLADLAHQHRVQSFVMISTDKAVNPTSVMGTCKRVAELYVQALADHSDCRFVTVRFGNVLDSAGSVIPVFRQQLAEGGPLTVTHPEMTRFFMTIPEASQLVIQAGTMGRGGEIFVLDMGEPVRIVDLAEDMVRLSGLRVGEDIEIRFVGMRPGEKLYEELHVDGEKHLPTSHPKILVAQADHCGLEMMRSAVEDLAEQTESPRDAILDQLLQIVPQYRGEHRRRRAA